MLTVRNAADQRYYRAESLADGRLAARPLSAAPWEAGQVQDDSRAMTLAELTAPLLPSKIIGIGQNYFHGPEKRGRGRPERPLLFLKPPSSLLPSGEQLVIPPFCERVEYEVELGVVIGRRARHVRRADAMDYVFGYTVLCDVTARDLQPLDKQWTRAKGCDGFCPIGPAIVDAQRLDPNNLRLQLWQNGELRQDGSTSEMLFKVDELIEFVSAAMTLWPGDVLSTGTPTSGSQLHVGDQLRMRVQGIPELSFTVGACVG